MIDALAFAFVAVASAPFGLSFRVPNHNPICPLDVNAKVAFRGKRGRGDNDRASKKYR